jgi:hypothetical protein
MINNILDRLRNEGYSCEILSQEEVKWTLPHLDEYKKRSPEHEFKGMDEYPTVHIDKAIIKIDNKGNLNWLYAPEFNSNLMPSAYMTLKRILKADYGEANLNYTVNIKRIIK